MVGVGTGGTFTGASLRGHASGDKAFELEALKNLSPFRLNPV